MPEPSPMPSAMPKPRAISKPNMFPGLPQYRHRHEDMRTFRAQVLSGPNVQTLSGPAGCGKLTFLMQALEGGEESIRVEFVPGDREWRAENLHGLCRILQSRPLAACGRMVWVVRPAELLKGGAVQELAKTLEDCRMLLLSCDKLWDAPAMHYMNSRVPKEELFHWAALANVPPAVARQLMTVANRDIRLYCQLL